MGALTQGLRTILGVVAFFAMVYLAYLCACLAPAARLRRWRETTSWLLAWPARPAEAIVIDSVAGVAHAP